MRYRSRFHVAVKTSTNPTKLSDNNLRKVALKEARATSTLEACVYLPHLIGVCLDEPPFKLVIQYGGDITVLKATQERALSRVIPWMKVCREMVEGVKAIHRSNIIHNDLKDDNVLLRKNMAFAPLIIDFGKTQELGATKPQRKPPVGKLQQ
ncbi:calcium/calmodulin-dependent serine/threonine-protein kinase-like [Patiria miniata]|uniref:Protein kinase domain-containing protein n=1 Tax=Patiria miniata TaxID=46514 RepID=A0A914AQM3_PATMI|nr:calcium/calmodulin-dependent serine/threonine-protein kinase-like [Patiria miniata]